MIVSTYAPDQIPSGSYDNSAVSIVVANRNPSDPRKGMFFDSEFAVASPIYFQDLGNGKFFGIFSERWHTVSRASDASDSNLFDSHVVDYTPSWTIFDGASGHRTSIPGHYGNTPPSNIPCDSRSVVGACSRANYYLFMLQRYIVSDQSFGVVSHFHINPVTFEVNLLGEEKIPSVVVGEDLIVFDQGIRYDSAYLNVAGRDSMGRIYMARKNWGDVGRPGGFEYQSEKGWIQDPASFPSDDPRSQRIIAPLRASRGELISAGPVSFADYRGRTWISVVNHTVVTEGEGEAAVTTTEASAQIFMSRGLWDAWTPMGLPYDLGVVGSTYLGGTLYFQPGLRINAARFSDFSVTGIPVVYSVKRVVDDAEAMDINWELFPVRS